MDLIRWIPLLLGAVVLSIAPGAQAQEPKSSESEAANEPAVEAEAEQPEPIVGEWRQFGADGANTKYSPLAQIDRTNFDQLEIAWQWESTSQRVVADHKRVRPGQFKTIPLMVGGRLFLSTEISQVVALDPGSGEIEWFHDPEAWKAGRPANLGFQHRGLAWWSDSRSDDARVFITTHDRKLVALNTRTGKLYDDFGDAGVVDLLPADGEEHFGRRINRRLLTHSSPPAVVGDVVVVGSIVHDGAIRRSAPPGHVRGFDARTGKLRWVFHTIAQEGEYGVETWEDESWKVTGNTNVWSMMAVDHELGYVYLPVSTPTNDFYGGHRKGDNLFAESLVCLNAETGERVWHFQMVHHGLWDYDLPTAPNLLDIVVDGKAIKAVAQVSKQAFTYVFDRVTGEPVWPIVERPVPASKVPGERAAETQPFPTRPPPFDRQGFGIEDLLDLTPELHEEALEIAGRYALGPLFTPPIVADTDGKIGLLGLPGTGGGANWQGAAVDPETGLLYVPSSTAPQVFQLSQPDRARSDLDYVGQFFVDLRGPQGLPLVKPPWGRVTAIDLNRGEHVWMRPNGHGPRDHPALRDLDTGLLGSGSGAPLLTKTLLFVTQTRIPGRDNGPRLNVFDKKTGELLGHVPLPDTPNANPITYMHDGRQYIVVAVGGGPYLGGYSEDAAEIDPDLAELLKRMGNVRGTKPQLVALALPQD